MHAILHTLLDRFEQPGRRQVARVYLRAREHGAYFSDEHAQPRYAVNQSLRELAAQGLVVLHWRRWEEGNWLEAVDLPAAGAAGLRAYLGRPVRAEQEATLRALLAAQQPIAGWHAAFLAWAGAQLAQQRSAAPLDRNDLEGTEALLRALAGLAALKEPTLERVLSVRLFGASKRLAGLRNGLLRVLRRHDPDAALYADDDDALLRAHQLIRAPEYVPLAGPLTLLLPEPQRELILAPFSPSLALPAPLLRAATVQKVAARTLITVENLTSFSDLCALRPPELLVVYTGGFASPTVIGLLRALRAAAPALTCYHWGDMDVGGLRILAQLRARLGELAPLAMDAATLTQHQTATQPLHEAERRALEELQTHPLLTDCRPLIEQMLAIGCKLEQEAVAVGALVSV